MSQILSNHTNKLDKENAEFWNELCGSGLARSLGMTEISVENLRRFDQAYLAMYPYLEGYLNGETLANKKVLEIGLGYGTLGQLLASNHCEYYGLDIAEGPVAMMRYRLKQLGKKNTDENIIKGSALNIPYQDACFDYVYTIGCLHHTGNLKKAVSEVYRVLVPGEKAIVMLYNRYSFRQFTQVPLVRLRTLFSHQSKNSLEHIRAIYDTNEQGKAAPHTDYVSRYEAKRLFKNFSEVKIDIQNFDNYMFKGIGIPRKKLLNNLGRILGLDLYITATK